MKLGILTAVYEKLMLEPMLAKVAELGIEQIELGTGGWPRSAHVSVDDLLASKDCSREFLGTLSHFGCTISALSCHGNPIHPNPSIAARYDEAFRKSVLLAERLGVPTVVTFSGCPGDAAASKTPNWVTTPWPPEFGELLEWQWEKIAIPYWREAGEFARSHGVRVAIEAHPGFLVYNVETLHRLRNATSEAIGINFDPSHLYWQGMHIPTAIAALKGTIFNVHAKDVAFSRHNMDTNGVLDTKSYLRVSERSWSFRTVGFGHGEVEWREILSALRMAGYDGVVSIEHEDPLASTDEGVRMAVELLKRIMFREPAAEAWWV